MSLTLKTVACTVQLDTAVFPAHTITDVSSTFISADVDLSMDADNGSATVRLTSMPGAAAERVRLYIYAGTSGTALIFNGEIAGMEWNDNGTVTLLCQDAMARLRQKWSKEDRTYNAAGSATDGSVIQNLVEASGIDATLTHITSTSWALGVVQDVILHGGAINLVTGDPGQCDVVLDLIRLIDQSTPLYRTYSRGDGAVYRTPRTVGGASGSTTYSDGGSGTIWGVTRKRDATAVVNASKVIGLTIADVPLSSLNQAASSWIVDPPKYISEEINSYLIEDQTHANAVTAAIVTEKNARLNTVSFTTYIDNTLNPGIKIALTASTASLSSKSMLVVHVHHHIEGSTGTTSATCEYREA